MCLPLRRLALLICGLAGAALLPAPASGGVANGDAGAAAAVIAEGVAAPGAAWAVSTPQGTVTGASGPVDADTAFLWGSVSKPVAGLVAAELVRTGGLDLSTPVLRLLDAPDPTDDRWRDVTVGMLLDHTSGVPRLLDLLDDEEPDRPLDAAVAAILGEPLVAGPGTDHRYSSANYLVLQAVLERVAGEPYAELVAAELAGRGVADPVVSREQAEARVTVGHRFVVGRPVDDHLAFDDLGLAYGYLGGSVRDLLAIGRSVLEDLGRSGGSAAAIATRPRVELGDGAHYGLGWRTGRFGGQEVLWHAGGLPGHTAFLALLPETGAVVAVLQDAYGPLHDAALVAPGLDAVRVLAGEPPRGAGPALGYWGVVAGLSVLLVVVLWGTARLLARRGRPPGPRSLAWGLVGLLAALTPLLLPTLTGLGDLATVARWLPDVAVLTLACGASGALLLLVLAGVSLRPGRRPHGHSVRLTS